MLIFGWRSTSDDWLGWPMDSNPIHHLSPAIKLKCSFLDYVQLLMISWAGWWTWTPSATPLQPKKWNAHFLDYIQHLMIGQADQWTQIPSATPLQPKKMKCSFLDYIQILMISWASRWTWTPSATSLQPKKWNAHFWITFNFWWFAGLVDGLKCHPPPLTSLKLKCSFWDYIQLLMINWAGQWTQTPSTTPLQPKIEMLIFWLCSNSDDQLGWSMDLNPTCHPSPAKKMKCSFLHYIQLLMIS